MSISTKEILNSEPYKTSLKYSSESSKAADRIKKHRSLSRIVRKKLEAFILSYLESERGFAQEEISKIAQNAKTEDELFEGVRNSYCNKLFDHSCWTFKDLFAFNERIDHCKANPQVSGLPDGFDADCFRDKAIPAGVTYALVYYALTGKPITEKDMPLLTKINKYQEDFIEMETYRWKIRNHHSLDT